MSLLLFRAVGFGAISSLVTARLEIEAIFAAGSGFVSCWVNRGAELSDSDVSLGTRSNNELARVRALVPSIVGVF